MERRLHLLPSILPFLRIFFVSGEMAGHHTSSEANPGSFNPYLEGMSYPGQYGLYPHHFSKLRGPHDLNYGDYPTKPQQAVPTYKWMQVKRNVPKPGKQQIELYQISVRRPMLAAAQLCEWRDLTEIRQAGPVQADVMALLEKCQCATNKVRLQRKTSNKKK